MYNSVFNKKLENVFVDMLIDVGPRNSGLIELQAKYLEEKIGLEKIIYNLPDNNENFRYEHALQILLGSECLSEKTIELMNYNNSHAIAYKTITSICVPITFENSNKVIESLKNLASHCKDNPGNLFKSTQSINAEIKFDCLIAAYGSAEAVLRSMSLYEIIAHSGVIKDHGYPELESNYIPNPIPDALWLTIKGFKREVYKPFYNLLNKLHGPLKAQKMLPCKQGTNTQIIFIEVSDLPEPICNNPAEFVKFAMSSNEKLYENTLALTVGAMRNSNRIAELDTLDPKHLKRLWKNGLINSDDAATMPNLLRLNKRKVLEEGLGL